MTRDLPTVLHAESVRFVRDRRALLDDVSLTVREGEHWALLGANGAGKSTLLSLLGAHRHPTSGQVHILGHRLGVLTGSIELVPHWKPEPEDLDHAEELIELLGEGRVLASGAADGVLTTELISACFDHPITIAKAGGRWTARAS
ncbi:MAG: ATP-binding cassette domain-containing protein [Actinoallomurus sp.]